MRCTSALLNRTDYPSLHVIIADNDTRDPGALKVLSRLRREKRVHVVPAPGAFNFAAICNAAAATGSGRVLVFMNNDVEAANTHWLDALVERAIVPGTGAVGAKLSYRSGAIQHAGIVLGLHGAAGHVYRGAASGERGYLDWLKHDHVVSAVTGACLAVERRKFEEAAGFDAVNFPVEFNDVDLCLRLRDRGYVSIWTPDAMLLHAESASRGRVKFAGRGRLDQGERASFLARWGAVVANDPCFHPAFSLASELPRFG